MEHFLAVKFDMGYKKKNMSFLVIPKSLKVLKKNEKNLMGAFNWIKIVIKL